MICETSILYVGAVHPAKLVSFILLDVPSIDRTVFNSISCNRLASSRFADVSALANEEAKSGHLSKLPLRKIFSAIWKYSRIIIIFHISVLKVIFL